ncbi:6709_t:CDS:2 [Gigaspora rosea]|nr:6709_t:CDS:2 [Gigaspora rosea]
MFSGFLPIRALIGSNACIRDCIEEQFVAKFGCWRVNIQIDSCHLHEPTVGMNRQKTWDFLKELNQQGTTIKGKHLASLNFA